MAFASTSTNTTATPAAHSIGRRLHSAGSIAGRPLEFAQARLARDDQFRLTGGLRDSFDDERDIGGRNVTFNGCAPPSVSNCGPYTYGLSLAELQANNYAVSNNDAYTSSHKLTYLARADFNITPDLLVYASVGTGYHPGRIEDGGTHDNPETLTNYEIGEKSTLLDGRVTANAALIMKTSRDIRSPRSHQA